MFKFKRKEEKPSVVDPLITGVIEQMEGHDEGTEDYTDLARNLKTLMEIKAMEPKEDRVSANTMAVIAANLAGIAMILAFERLNVVTSKGLAFILRPKT